MTPVYPLNIFNAVVHVESVAYQEPMREGIVVCYNRIEDKPTWFYSTYQMFATA